MNADDFNARYPVGTPVFAYPGARPEDFPNDTRLVTRTRSRASVLGGHTDVVWVDGHSAYIALSHVDPVSEDEFEKARAEETAAAVAAVGALPVPVGDQPQPLDDTRLAEIRAHVAETRNWSLGNLAARDLLAEVERLSEQVERLKDDKVRRLDQQAKDDDEYIQATAERDRYRLAWQSARERAQAYGEGILSVVKDRESYQQWLKQAEAQVAVLQAERHTTNEALSDAAEQLRANRDRIGQLEAELAKLIRWHGEDGAYEQRLREQHDRDVAELNRLRARIAELERPAIEAKRDEVRQSYAELAAQCREDRDHEAAFDVECRIREREEQWKREDEEATS